MRDLSSRLASTRTRDQMLLALFDLDGFKDYNDAFGHPAGDALLVRLAGELEASLGRVGGVYRIGGDEFCALLEGRDQERLLAQADLALSEQGEGFKVTASRGAVRIPSETASPAEALRLADQRMYANKTGTRAATGRQTTHALVSLLAERHPDLGKHLDRVGTLCRSVAEELGLPAQELTTLLQAAALHDVGKIAVPDSVLEKPGRLNEEEWRFIREHTLIGERIVGSTPALKRASKLVRWSHERIDGKGYPDGIEGEKIPLGSRIIAVCDAYVAITAGRRYARASSAEEALEELRDCAGTQFDAEVVEALARVQAREGAPPPDPAARGSDSVQPSRLLDQILE
jgi:diguanylate cyclase (GGDEF)-like protein